MESILDEGLKSMGRQYVHLSSTAGEARKVGERRGPKPAILRIRAREAWEAGLTFH
ncbi:MAG: RNA 2'-phosphotransferase [Anaerolineales bacterium]|nr:RNA 2'-phosphotransferase [Anaerolineales bacterium]